MIGEGSRIQFYSRCHTQRRIGGAPPANRSFVCRANYLTCQFFATITKKYCNNGLWAYLNTRPCTVIIRKATVEVQWDTPHIHGFL